jgi:hypothetical protein
VRAVARGGSGLRPPGRGARAAGASLSVPPRGPHSSLSLPHTHNVSKTNAPRPGLWSTRGQRAGGRGRPAGLGKEREKKGSTRELRATSQERGGGTPAPVFLLPARPDGRVAFLPPSIPRRTHVKHHNTPAARPENRQCTGERGLSTRPDRKKGPSSRSHLSLFHAPEPPPPRGAPGPGRPGGWACTPPAAHGRGRPRRRPWCAR